LRILVINNLELPFPPGLRLEKEYKALIQAGHEVLIVARKNANNINCEAYNICDISDENRSFLKKLFFMIFWDDFRLREKIIKRIESFKPEIVIGIDLQWSRFAYKVARHFKTKFVVDFLENMPEAVQTHLRAEKPIKRYIKRISGLYSKKRLRKYELNTVKNADLVLVVIEEARERFRELPGILDKTLVIKNTELPTQWKYEPRDYERTQAVFQITYVGGIGEHRGIDILIKSTQFIQSNNYHVTIIGFDPSSYYYLKMEKLVKSINRREFITLKRVIPFSEVENELLGSDILAIPHNSSGHTNTTVPHKLFQYMCVGKPILVSDVKPLKRIVEECDCGIIFKAGNPIDCGEKITWCMNHVKELSKKGYNGRYWVEKKYRWENDSACFLEKLRIVVPQNTNRFLYEESRNSDG
jgi:glycosyltransferase involved in cell wall biosynthesis